MKSIIQKFIATTSFTAVLLLLSACEQMPKVDYDSEAVFKESYKYTWIPQKKMEPHPVISELTMERVRDSANKRMAADGWQQVDEAEAEMLLHAFIIVETKVESTGFQAHYGTYYGYPRAYTGYAGVSSPDIRTYEVGTLVIDMVDPKTEKLLWRGHYQSRIKSGGTPEGRKEKIETTVNKIFDAFPPEKES